MKQKKYFRFKVLKYQEISSNFENEKNHDEEITSPLKWALRLVRLGIPTANKGFSHIRSSLKLIKSINF